MLSHYPLRTDREGDLLWARKWTHTRNHPARRDRCLGLQNQEGFASVVLLAFGSLCWKPEPSEFPGWRVRSTEMVCIGGAFWEMDVLGDVLALFQSLFGKQGKR